MEYTKKELAEICGVSVQAIDKKLRKTGLMDGCSVVAGRLQIPATIAATVATSYQVKLESQQPTATKMVAEVAEPQQPQQPQQPNLQPSATSSNGSEKAVEALVSQLEALQKQLEVKDRQIADLSAALVSAQETAKAAQALHAADKAEAMAIESAEAKKSRWQRLKEAWQGGEAR